MNLQFFSLHDLKPISTCSLSLQRYIKKKVNGHHSYSNWFLNDKMKVLQLSENEEFCIRNLFKF